MSTYYFIICTDCKEICTGASRTAGGYCHLVDSDITLPPFIITHCGHNVRIITEHNPIAYEDDNYQRWTEDNIQEFYKVRYD